MEDQSELPLLPQSATSAGDVQGTLQHLLERPARPRRARVILQFVERAHGGLEEVHESERGWALIDGNWLWWLPDPDADDGWQTWPIQNVLCVQWEAH